MKFVIDVECSTLKRGPLCLNARPRKEKRELSVYVPDMSPASAPVAFIVTDGTSDSMFSVFEIRAYDNRFWVKAQSSCGLMDIQDMKMKIASTSLFEIEATAEKYIVIDDEVWQQVSEPKYAIMPYFMSHKNYGRSLLVSVNEHLMNHAIYFSALERNAAIQIAKELAVVRGCDNETAEEIGGHINIEVLMPELVKFKCEQ